MTLEAPEQELAETSPERTEERYEFTLDEGPLYAIKILGSEREFERMIRRLSDDSPEQEARLGNGTILRAEMSEDEDVRFLLEDGPDGDVANTIDQLADGKRGLLWEKPESKDRQLTDQAIFALESWQEVHKVGYRSDAVADLYRRFYRQLSEITFGNQDDAARFGALKLDRFPDEMISHIFQLCGRELFDSVRAKPELGASVVLCQDYGTVGSGAWQQPRWLHCTRPYGGPSAEFYDNFVRHFGDDWVDLTQDPRAAERYVSDEKLAEDGGRIIEQWREDRAAADLASRREAAFDYKTRRFDEFERNLKRGDTAGALHIFLMLFPTPEDTKDEYLQDGEEFLRRTFAIGKAGTLRRGLAQLLSVPVSPDERGDIVRCEFYEENIRYALQYLDARLSDERSPEDFRTETQPHKSPEALAFLADYRFAMMSRSSDDMRRVHGRLNELLGVGPARAVSDGDLSAIYLDGSHPYVFEHLTNGKPFGSVAFSANRRVFNSDGSVTEQSSKDGKPAWMFCNHELDLPQTEKFVRHFGGVVVDLELSDAERRIAQRAEIVDSLKRARGLGDTELLVEFFVHGLETIDFAKGQSTGAFNFEKRREYVPHRDDDIFFSDLLGTIIHVPSLRKTLREWCENALEGTKGPVNGMSRTSLKRAHNIL